MVEVNDFVWCVGEGRDVFKVEKLEGSRALLNTGWWEPIKKLTVLPKDKVHTYTQEVYIYNEEL